MKNRRFVVASISARRAAPGPIRMLATRRAELDLVRLRARAGGQRAELPLGVDRGRRLGEDDSVAAAGRALLGEDLARAVRDVLPRHLDQAERRDLDDVGLRPVALELGGERLLDRGAVLRARHVDEIDHDDPTDVAEAELADDLLDRFEIVLGDRVLEPGAGGLRARADEAAGVHVDDGERLGVVEDQVAAGGQVDAAAQRGADLGVDAERLHQRRLVLVPDHALDHVRRGLLQVADDALVGTVVVDHRALEVTGEEVAHDAQRQLGLLVDELGRLRGLGAGLDRLPEALEEDEVALDVLCGRAFCGGADDHAALRDVELLDDLLEPGALVVRKSARHAEPLALRHEDDEATGQRDLGGEPRALRLHRVLDRLDEQLLAARDQILDLLAVPFSFELGHDDLVDVEEAVLLEADLDERGLHSRQDVVDGAEIDVAGDRAAFGPLEVDLGDAVVLEHRDTLLADVDRDEELALRGRERRALGRLATACGRAGLALRLRGAALGRLALGRLLLAGGGRRSRGGGGGAGLGAGRLLAAASAAATATALCCRSCLLSRRSGTSLGNRCYGRCRCGRSGLRGPLLGRFLASKPRQGQRKLLHERAHGRDRSAPGGARAAGCG